MLSNKRVAKRENASARRAEPQSGLDDGVVRKPFIPSLQPPRLLLGQDLLQVQRVIGNQAVGQLLAQAAQSRYPQQPTASAAPTAVLQRFVGLEMEHNVPVYKNVAGRNQEESLRLGSYSYNNAEPVYVAGNITAKVDNTIYSLVLKKQLEQENPHNYETKIPDKGVSILEYTTTAPGLDELQPRARSVFAQHTSEIEQAIRTSLQGSGSSKYYIGLPIGVPINTGYGDFGVQVTVGVFPSKLDELHKRARKHGHIDRDLRYVQDDISRIIKALDPVGNSMFDDIRDFLRPEGEFWNPDRAIWVVNARGTLDEFEADIRARVFLPLVNILSDTLRSLFRISLSYYLGARKQVARGEIEKNAVPLLVRLNLSNIFKQAGASEYIWRRLSSHIANLLEKRSAEIDNIVAQGMTKQGEFSYQKYANPGILPADLQPSNMMIRIMKGEVFGHIKPGKTLIRPDLLDIKSKGYNEPVRPERGGTQVEYRTLDAGGWQLKFLDIAKDAFELNTQHLPPDQQARIAKDTEWARD